MVLTEEEKEKAMQMYKLRQQRNTRYREKTKNPDAKRRSQRSVDDPSDEQLEQIYAKNREMSQKKLKEKYPQTEEEIMAAMEKLIHKLVTIRVFGQEPQTEEETMAAMKEQMRKLVMMRVLTEVSLKAAC